MKHAEDKPMTITLTRRTVLKRGGAATGLMLFVRTSGALGADEKITPKYGADAFPGGAVDNPLVFVAIGADGIVNVTVHRPEMGQGVRTSFAMVIADELEADWSRVKVNQAPADEERYGSEDTDGSRSMRHFLEPMRRVGDAARMMLISAAAARWGVPAGEVTASNHELIHAPSGRRIGYGAVAQSAARLKVPSRASLQLKDPK